MLKTVVVSNRLRQYGIKENHRGYPRDNNLQVFGADTETVKGRIHTIQVSGAGDKTLLYVSPKSAFKRLMDWLRPHLSEKGVNLVWFHNLRFDIAMLLGENHEAIYNQYNDIHLERDGYVIKMLYGRVNFVRIWEDLGGYLCKRCGEIPALAVRREKAKSDGKNFVPLRLTCGNPRCSEMVRRNLGTRIQFVDSAAFCPPGSKSLAAALKIYGVEAKKFPQPKGLGKKYLRSKVFESYALNDAVAEEALGQAILGVHKEYDITPCVSLPQLAGRILRHHFFRRGETFPFPPEPCRVASELSYHAGKNGFYVKPGVYEDLYEYDINSAFPCAMRELPQIVKGRYAYVKKFRCGYMGIYRIKGRVPKTNRYPVVFDSAFAPVKGHFRDLWITGYEIQCLRESRQQFRIIDGWIWRHDKTYRHSPLGEFVDRFWKLKSESPKGPKRDTYKNILNSLYGKFAACVEKRPTIQTAYGPVEINDGEAPRRYFVAGALYHPFIATQITGYVRARLWELERRGKALHAATDSIKSRHDLSVSDGLGGIKKETFGRCYLFRNKLYLHFAKDTSLCGHNLERGWLYVSQEDRRGLNEVQERRRTGYRDDKTEGRTLGKLFDSDGQHLCKFGLHGFKGSVFFLYKHRKALLNRGYLDYEYDHMVQLREGFKRNERICDMTRRKERLLLSAP